MDCVHNMKELLQMDCTVGDCQYADSTGGTD